MKLTEDFEKECLEISKQTGEEVDRVKSLTLNEYFIRLSFIKDKIDSEQRNRSVDNGS